MGIRKSISKQESVLVALAKTTDELKEQNSRLERRLDQIDDQQKALSREMQEMKRENEAFQRDIVHRVEALERRPMGGDYDSDIRELKEKIRY